MLTADLGGIGIICSFKEHGIQKDAGSDQHPLLVRGRVFWKANFKGVAICKDLDCCTFGLFHNYPEIRSIAVGIGLIGIVDTERYFATSLLRAWIALGAAIDAHATTAGRRMHGVHGLSFRIKDLEGRDTVKALFLDRSQGIPATGKRRFLVAATLAGADIAAKGTVDCDYFSICV